MILDCQIWESYAEDSQEVFQHFKVQKVWRLDESEVASPKF
jgi:hypothetical protein